LPISLMKSWTESIERSTPGKTSSRGSSYLGCALTGPVLAEVEKSSWATAWTPWGAKTQVGRRLQPSDLQAEPNKRTPHPASVAVPNAAGEPAGATSRELRIWPQKNLLIELAFRCSSVIHACPHTGDVVKIFSLSGWYAQTYIGARRL
jgi:hypothetical protein